ncbi:hypothetical protein DESACE_06580 [Desulfurella acetivorans A63]|nr:hypothetical protein DESACE_06580 [Desulfurella acetivorans A63]
MLCKLPVFKDKLSNALCDTFALVSGANSKIASHTSLAFSILALLSISPFSFFKYSTSSFVS